MEKMGKCYLFLTARYIPGIPKLGHDPASENHLRDNLAKAGLHKCPQSRDYLSLRK